MYLYRPRYTCARAINIELDGDKIVEVNFFGGCEGNLKAISKVVKGMTIDQVAELWEGNTCGPKVTSCTDQLVKGLREAYAAAQAEQEQEAATE